MTLQLEHDIMELKRARILTLRILSYPIPPAQTVVTVRDGAKKPKEAFWLGFSQHLPKRISRYVDLRRIKAGVQESQMYVHTFSRIADVQG